MSDQLLDIKEKLEGRFGDGIISAEMHYDFPVFVVKKSIIIDVLSYLKNEPGLQFKFLTTMCGIHFPENIGAELCMMYQLHNMEQSRRVRIKIFMPDGEVNVPTA